jgi:arsenite-transporting ATPase
LIVNQVLVQDDSYEYRNLPAHPAFDWYTERIAEQQSVLDELGAGTGDVGLVLAPHLAGEPIGPKALAELLDCARRRGGAARPALRAVVELESGSGLDSVYRMRLSCPRWIRPRWGHAVGRVDDDLIIGVGGLRRRVRLASVLRRCTVAMPQLAATS